MNDDIANCALSIDELEAVAAGSLGSFLGHLCKDPQAVAKFLTGPAGQVIAGVATGGVTALTTAALRKLF
jgi:hypothetical protein